MELIMKEINEGNEKLKDIIENSSVEDIKIGIKQLTDTIGKLSNDNDDGKHSLTIMLLQMSIGNISSMALCKKD